MVELSLAEMLEEQRNYKYVFPTAVQENEEKVVDVAKQEQKLAKEFGTTKPQVNTEENCREKPSMEGICISMTKELLAEDKQDLIVYLLILVTALVLKQELPEVLIGRSGGLDPREVIDVRDLVEEVAIMGMEEEKQEVQQDQKDACLKQEVRSSGDLDTGEVLTVNKEEECIFKDKAVLCVTKDRVEVKEEMKQRPLEVRMENLEEKGEIGSKYQVEEVIAKTLKRTYVEVCKDAQVWELLCNPLFNIKFELLLAWLHMSLTLRLRFVNVNSYNAAFRSKHDYG